MAVTYERTTGDPIDPRFDRLAEMAEAQTAYADLEDVRAAHAQRRRADTLALIAAGADDGRYSLMGREVL